MKIQERTIANDVYVTPGCYVAQMGAEGGICEISFEPNQLPDADQDDWGTF